jgi:uncharacterized RDD family membrane protein YckC
MDDPTLLRDAAVLNRQKRVMAFIVAAASAPLVTLAIVIALLWLKPHGMAPSHSHVGSGLEFAAFTVAFFGMTAILFGFPGSAALLGLSFHVLRVATKGSRRLRTCHFVLAGVAAGVMHVALAYLSLHGVAPRGSGFLLGTWLVRTALQQNGVQAIIAPTIAGAVAGRIYAGMRPSATSRISGPISAA